MSWRGVTVYTPLAYLGYQFLLPVVPISFFVAIQRYRLYGIDTIIRRTLVYGALTAVLVGVYLVGVVGTQTLVAASPANRRSRSRFSSSSRPW